MFKERVDMVPQLIISVRKSFKEAKKLKCEGNSNGLYAAKSIAKRVKHSEL